MREELKPCPFCGGKAELEVLKYFRGDMYAIYCTADLSPEKRHGHFITDYETEAEAIADWNRRANDK